MTRAYAAMPASQRVHFLTHVVRKRERVAVGERMLADLIAVHAVGKTAGIARVGHDGVAERIDSAGERRSV